MANKSTLEKELKEVYGRLKRNPRLQENLDKGEPRPGHPEGSVRKHVQELERNLEKIKALLSPEEYWRLKVMAIVHDAFKAEAETKVPINDPKSHSSIAAVFLMDEMFAYGWSNIGKERALGLKTDLLRQVQYHDAPYALWLRWKKTGEADTLRMADLEAKISDWDAFLAFVLIDGITKGKSAEPAEWFLREARKRKKTKVALSWIRRIRSKR